jgi:hypothetical protein
MTKKRPTHAEVTARMLDFAKIEQVLIENGRRVLREHARAGRQVPVWRDNQVVWVDAASLLSEDDPPTNSRQD